MAVLNKHELLLKLCRWPIKVTGLSNFNYLELTLLAEIFASSSVPPSKSTMVPQTSAWQPSSISFSIHNSLITLSFGATWSETQTEPLNKSQLIERTPCIVAGNVNVSEWPFGRRFVSWRWTSKIHPKCWWSTNGTTRCHNSVNISIHIRICTYIVIHACAQAAAAARKGQFALFKNTNVSLRWGGPYDLGDLG